MRRKCRRREGDTKGRYIGFKILVGRSEGKRQIGNSGAFRKIILK
jgi:hypothetical protein